MSVVAIIPARGGSKGIPGKNLKLLSKHPLIAHSILDAKESQLVDEVFVSTDSSEIANISKQYGANVIDRPKDLASDQASSESELLHALGQIEEKIGLPSIVIFLQCTSPIRTGEDIDFAVKKFQAEGADSLLSALPS